MRTVKQVSDLTGISVRALRYYDEIGLLKPSEITWLRLFSQIKIPPSKDFMALLVEVFYNYIIFYMQTNNFIF